MVLRRNLVLIVLFILGGIIFSICVSAQSIDCFRYTGNYSGCKLYNSTCLWGNNSGAVAEDSFCMIRYDNYNSTSQTMYAPWLGISLPFFNLTGNQIVNSGCCIMKMGAGGGGMSMQGCQRYDKNQTGCSESYTYIQTNCTWKPNDLNQNPMCGNNIGCCENLGCWSFAGTQTASNNCSTAFSGLCVLDNFCPSGNCCRPKSCNEATSEEQCNKLSSQLNMPCVYSGGQCTMPGGGFTFYNDTGSCVQKGGFWNGTACNMPSSSGGGGFMYAQEAKCWFADNKILSCRNVTGCVYCSDSASQLTNASSACYNAPSGSCKGHEPLSNNWNGTASVIVRDINQSSMTCSDIKLKQICSCGPLPFCTWSNSSANYGNYCTAGMKTNSEISTCQPPVMFCEDVRSKNNQTLCDSLASDYMMPCKWDTTNNCTFNNIAVFGGGNTGGGGGGMNYNVISSEMSCIAAGGTWRTENYVDSDGSFKSDSWCEKGAMFSFSSGTASANKGSCDSDCWACEFNSTGGNYGGNLTLAQNACTSSKKGYCQFKADSNAPNGLGWCDYPKEFGTGGTKECNSDCKTCEYMGDAAQAQQACYSSTIGCLWVNDSSALNGKGGFCMSSSKKSCTTDCFSCYEQSKCSNSSFHTAMNCSWDLNFKLCKPQGFTGEICFNGQDDDNDQMKDCADSDCTYDVFCGGASTGSGSVDCKKIFIQASCINNKTASGINCTWIQSSFGNAYCDFPGSDCWMFNNITSCATGKGCIFRNATAGYPSSSVKIDYKAFAGFCDINKTKSEVCFNSSNRISFANCNATSECVWINDSYSGGRCEFKPFYYCGNAQDSSSCNSISGGNMCAWRNNSFSSTGGFCEPSCAGKIQAQCSGFCAWKSTSCEPEAFGGMEGGGSGAGGIGGGFGCHMYDGNRSACVGQNMSCSWMTFSQNSSQGICESKGQQMMMAGMDQGVPKPLGIDSNDTSVKEIDIKGYGVKDTPSSLGFGIMVTNISDAAVCRGYYVGGMGGSMGQQPVLGSGTSTTKFHWFLDVNKNTGDGCNATNSSGSNLTGFEFLIKYVVLLDNSTVSETKSFYKCSSGSWVLTNVPIASNRQFMCGTSMPGEAGHLGGVMVLVDKENLQSFPEYNKTVPMRVFISSANSSSSELAPLDSANIGYYTPGSADFKFVDCSNPSTKDAKCMNFQKFGFNVFEDCKNGKDDDSDGYADCADPKCKFTPNCASGSAFSFVFDANDNQAPTITFSQVDVLRDGAFVKFDTDEPANGTLSFYYNDSTCNTVNATMNDLGDPSIAFDDHKPFHLVALELNTLGYSLTNGTIYYYKTSVCDPSANCATSACQNFTTSNDAYKNFIFKMKLPAGYNVTIPSLNYSGNFTTSIAGTVYDIGLKTNASVSRNLNITVNCGTQSLTFIGADILTPKSIDMSNAFICNQSSNILGMNSTSKSWNQLIGDIGMGGQSDSIRLTFPVDYSSGNSVKWCGDDGSTNCTNVNSYANCSSGGTGKTDCKIPTSLGFSAYKVETSSTTSTTTTSGGGGGGGGGGAAATYSVSSALFESGYSVDLKKNDKIRFPVNGENHTLKLVSFTETSAMINVSSITQQATLAIGESKTFDVTEDSVNDLSVKLNSINYTAKKVNIFIQKLAATSSVPGTGKAIEEPGATGEEPAAGGEGIVEEGINWKLWVGIIIVLIIIIIIVIFIYRKRRY